MAKTNGSQTTVHSLNELGDELLKLSDIALEYKSLKDVIGQPLVITSVTEATKSGYMLVTAYLVGDSQKEFKVRVHSAQPKKVLTAVLQKKLLPVSGVFERAGAQYVLKAA